MLVSIVIPFYHGNKYLNQIMSMMRNNSNRSQKNGIDLECVIVNDSPDDDVQLVIDDFPFTVQIVNNQVNMGIHKTRIHGLEKCKGDYVLFLDQDDYISDDFIVSQVLAIGTSDFVVSNGYIQEMDGRKRPIFNSLAHQRCCLNLDYHYGYTNPIISPGQVLLKRSVIPDEWKKHFFTHNGADDHYLWLLLLENGQRGTLNEKCLYTHIATGTNTSLNVDEMCKSNMELVDLMSSIATKKRLKMLKRRSLYYGSNPERLFTKICFADVGIARRRFSRLQDRTD